MTDHRAFQPLFKRWSRCNSLTDDDRRAFADLPWQQQSHGRESYILRQGEPTRVCTLLLEGLAFRQKLVSDGARQIISFHIPGELLDLQNCLLGVADHNVQSLSRSTVVVVPKDSLVDLMEKRPGVRRALWFDSLIDAAIFREWVVNIGRRDARQRIAHLLCEIAARLESSGIDSGPVFHFPFTQEQIADATGLTTVHTNRTLQSLRRDGLISLSLNKLTILDWDALTELGDFNHRYLHHAV